MTTEIEATLVRYISEEILEFDEPISRVENLLADDMIDSLGMLRLVAYIEATFDKKIPPADFTIENFRNVEALVSYLDSA